jgi:chromate reductase
VRVLAITGSLRADSHNTVVLRAVADAAPAGVRVDLYDESATIPPYSEDADHGEGPLPVRKVRALVAAADAVLIATPEYNGAPPGHLKTAIDSLSRPYRHSAIRGNPVAVISASTGSYGGIWAQDELRRILRIAGARVVDTRLAVPNANTRLRPELPATRRALAKLLEDLRAATEETRGTRSAASQAAAQPGTEDVARVPISVS